ncbi:MAG: hypothetical protein AB7L18_11370 [Hyphomicrobiaceae bacterium]
MVLIHTAGRRPTADVRRSAATTRPTSNGNPAVRSARDANDGTPASSRATDFEVLIDRAIASIRAAGDRLDPVFGAFAELNTIVRAVTYHEGKLLEWGVARLAAENSALVQMSPETALPIVPAAVELLKRNEWAGLEGLRLRSEVHTTTTYAPDLFLVDRDRHCALILDVKRSLASYPERKLNMLRRRMMAAALTAGDWLHIEGRVAGVSRVDIAIIDGSSERRDRVSGVFALDEIGDLIGVADAGDAMLELRANFAHRVQDEVEASCRRALDRGDGGTESPSADEVDAEDEDRYPTSSEDEPLDDAGDEEEAPGAIGHSHGRHRVSLKRPTERRPIVVGFARGGSP